MNRKRQSWSRGTIWRKHEAFKTSLISFIVLGPRSSGGSTAFCTLGLGERSRDEGGTRGAFPLVKISGISGSAVNGTRFVGSSHRKIPRKSGKSKKVGPFSWLEFPNGMSCSIYISLSLYQFQVHGRAAPRTGVYDQIEQLFTNRKFHFCYHWNFQVFFPKWKAPRVPTTKCTTFILLLQLTLFKCFFSIIIEPQ